MNVEEFTREELFELYKIYIDRENVIRKMWRTSFTTYSTIILTILGSIILLFGLFDKTLLNKMVLGLGGIIIIGFSLIAYFHCKLDYKYQMELLSVQMKIEDLLGLTDESFVKLPERWGSEALLPPWYYSNKNERSNSYKFIKSMFTLEKTNGYLWIYFLFGIVGTFLVVVAILY